jgi:ribosomal protein L32
LETATTAHPTFYFPPSSSSLSDFIQDSIWFAVPKRKVTPGKKRMKTTLQNRIPTKSHVIVDRRTGELTLRHKLPWNWKDYLPENLQEMISKDKKQE